jgi:hypothetical protein
MLLALAATVVTSARPDLPFHASLDTQPTILGPCGPGCLALDIPGSGIASHLGAITVGGPSRIDLVNGTQTATATFTAANGDTLVLDIAGTVQFSGPDPADPVTFTGSWTVQSAADVSGTRAAAAVTRDPRRDRLVS